MKRKQTSLAPPAPPAPSPSSSPSPSPTLREKRKRALSSTPSPALRERKRKRTVPPGYSSDEDNVDALFIVDHGPLTNKYETPHPSPLLSIQDPDSQEFEQSSTEEASEEETQEDLMKKIKQSRFYTMGNPKGKVLEYFQKKKLPIPRMEYRVRFMLDSKEIVLPKWVESVKEAEKQVAVLVLHELDQNPMNATIVTKCPKPAQKSNKKCKKEPPIEVPMYTSLGDSILDKLQQGNSVVKKRFYNTNTPTPKGDFHNLCAILGFNCQIKSEPKGKKLRGNVVKLLLNNQLFYAQTSNLPRKKVAEGEIARIGIDMLIRLKSFTTSSWRYLILLQSHPLYQLPSASFPSDLDSYFVFPNVPSQNIAKEIIQQVNWVLERKLQSGSCGKLYLGVSRSPTIDSTFSYQVQGIESSCLMEVWSLWNDLLKEKHISSDLPFRWQITPVYWPTEIEKAFHYKDIHTLSNRIPAGPTIDPNILFSVFQYNLHATLCILRLEIPSTCPITNAKNRALPSIEN